MRRRSFLALLAGAPLLRWLLPKRAPEMIASHDLGFGILDVRAIATVKLPDNAHYARLLGEHGRALYDAQLADSRAFLASLPRPTRPASGKFITFPVTSRRNG